MNPSEKYNVFMNPQVSQYGSHMLMSNVQLQSKTKYINIDTKFSDEFNIAQTSNTNADFLANQVNTAKFTISLPDPISNIKSMKVMNIEIPNTFYNISSNFGNNYLQIIDNTNQTTILQIPDGNYNSAGLEAEINNSATNLGLPITFSLSSTSNKTTISSSSGTYIMKFDVNLDGTQDKYRFKSKLGWLLGFRNIEYEITTNNTISECFYNLAGSKYLYLAIDEFNSGNQKSFISPLFNSVINKNILSRITIDSTTYPFNENIPASFSNGLLISDERQYNGKIDIQRLEISLLNEDGIPVILNGRDFSFCLQITYE